jgi:subtilisin-like proprotein convertase family protein
VSGVADVNVTLHGLTHTSPTALDVLLVGPAGQSVVLMSDVPTGASVSPACNTPASNLTLTFDDAAAGPIPGTAALTSGTYQPLDNDSPTCGVLGTNDNYPNPADDPPNGTTLADFNGTNPEGDWSLFVNDSRDGNSGAVNGGWSLEIKPPNNFSFGKVKKNKHKGTATISVDVPGPGTLELSGKGVKAQRPRSGERITAARPVSAAGTVTLPIKAKGKKKRKLNSKGKTKLKVNVTYTPAGGAPNTVPKSVKLVKNG